MSFPPPIIPQTPEQAVQRDTIAGLDAVQPDDPRVELERLRQAIREHRLAIRDGGDPMHEHDRVLWAYIGEGA